ANAVMSPIMVMNIAHQPTDFDPDWYNGSDSPSPTSLRSFSGITAVPVHSHASTTAIAHAPLAPAATYWPNTGRMNAPPVNSAAHSARNVGPGTRRHCSGVASRVEVTSVSRSEERLVG